MKRGKPCRRHPARLSAVSFPARHLLQALALACERVLAVEGHPAAPRAIRRLPRPFKRVAGGTAPVAVDVTLVSVRSGWAVVLSIEDTVLVGVPVVGDVAGVAHSVAVDVTLVSVRSGWAVVGRVGVPVAVAVAVPVPASAGAGRVLVAGVAEA